MAYPNSPALAPSFTKIRMLWRIVFQQDIVNIADLNMQNAGYFGVFPPMLTNPSQDYLHLKQRRADIQTQGYTGIRSPSSRSVNQGRILALFHNQAANVHAIDPVQVEFQLVQPSGTVFNNHATQELDFEACQVRVTSNPVPGWAQQFQPPQIVRFHH